MIVRNLIRRPIAVTMCLIALDAKDEKLDQSDVYLTAMEDKRQQLKDIYEEYGNQLLGRLWEQSLTEKGILTVTDEEISAYYDKYPYEMTIKQIIIPDAQTADAVYRELRRAKSRWNTLEKQYSTAPEQSKGKEITFMPGEFIPELEVIAANSPTGSVQGFVKTAQGFHIIMKTRERRLSLKDAAPRIRTVLENQKIDAALGRRRIVFIGNHFRSAQGEKGHFTAGEKGGSADQKNQQEDLQAD